MITVEQTFALPESFSYTYIPQIAKLSIPISYSRAQTYYMKLGDVSIHSTTTTTNNIACRSILAKNSETS